MININFFIFESGEREEMTCQMAVSQEGKTNHKNVILNVNKANGKYTNNR